MGTVFIATEAVDRKGDIRFSIRTTLGCDDKAKLSAGPYNPLAYLSITGQIGLNQVGSVFLLVAFKNGVYLLIGLEVVKEKYAATGGENSGPTILPVSTASA